MPAAGRSASSAYQIVSGRVAQTHAAVTIEDRSGDETSGIGANEERRIRHVGRGSESAILGTLEPPRLIGSGGRHTLDTLGSGDRAGADRVHADTRAAPFHGKYFDDHIDACLGSADMDLFRHGAHRLRGR